MADYGVLPTGFNRQRLADILENLNAKLKSEFGENFNTSPESAVGQLTGIFAEALSNLWEIAETDYNAFNPSAATNVTLQNLVQLNSITVLRKSPSLVDLELTGTPATLIPAGSLTSVVDTGVQFTTDNDITLDSLGEGTVSASSVLDGPIPAASDTITQIDSTIVGWDTVRNPEDATLGRLDETDTELRARRERSTAAASTNNIDGLFAAVSNIEGVTQAVVIENDTRIDGFNGLPANSYQVIVIGGDDEEIAETIRLKGTTAIPTVGNVEITRFDSQGIPHIIRFQRPTTILIYVIVTLTKFDDYPSDGDALMKQAIVDYANGVLVPGRGFGLSEDVIYTRLYTPINSIQGHEIDDLRIGTSANPTGIDNIEIPNADISLFEIANIDIVTT